MIEYKIPAHSLLPGCGLTLCKKGVLRLKNYQKILLGAVLVLLGAGISYLITYSWLTERYNNSMEQILSHEVVRKTAELEEYIDAYFVGETDETAMADAAASAMVSATGDRWSYYISAADYEAYMEQMNNAYVGIGITISRAEEDNGYTVMEVTKGGPAEEAGVLTGDLLTAVNGTSVVELEVDAVRNLVRGEEGTEVSLTLLRGEETLEIAVERRTIEQIAAEGTMLDGNVGYVKIENFDKNSADHTIAAIEALVDQGAESLLFDVRNNPGGYKDELVEVLDYLLPEGVLFRMVYYNGEETVDYSDEDCVTLPMAVLVNSESYSAAEFFAAALQEYGAAEVVGTQTCGKGYFQNTYRLSDGSAVSLSSGTYYTPKGVSLANVGITPDLVVEMEDEDFAALYYDQLEPEDDNQIQAALDLLK